MIYVELNTRNSRVSCSDHVKNWVSRYKCVLVVTVIGVLALGPSWAGPFTFAGEANGLDLICHPQGYTGTETLLTIEVCIDPASLVPSGATLNDLVAPVQNSIATWNQLQPTLGNVLLSGANNIPAGQIDFESVALHELGHCIGLAHVNAASESGLAGNDQNYTKATDGPNDAFDINPGPDGVIGSRDDIRGDDGNLHWFRIDTNDPGQLPLPSPIDASTYDHDLSSLPMGHDFTASLDRTVAATLGYPNTEAVMQQGTFSDEAQRTLTADGVATVLLAASGADETAGSADDYVINLVDGGISNAASCDLTVRFTSMSGLAHCIVAGSFISSPPGTTHARIASPLTEFGVGFNWFFNTSTSAPDLAHAIQVSSDIDIIVERAEYTDGVVNGELIYNALGSNSVGSTATSLNWYFPDVNTQEYTVELLLMNPSDSSTASVDINYLPQGGAPVLENYSLSPGRPKKITVNDNAMLANLDMSVIVTSDVGIVAEKTMSWSGTVQGDTGDNMGSSGTTGAPNASTQWYLAEGSTAGWKLWYTAMNPSPSQTATVTFNYLLEGAPPVSETFTLGPYAKRTVYVNDVLPSANVSLLATSDIPIVVERLMHWNANPGGGEINNVGGHSSMGVENLENLWYLAEGSTAGWNLWVLLMNPHNATVPATVTWLREGASPTVEIYNLAPNSRKTIQANLIPGLEFANVSVKVETSVLPILAERAMYWDTQMSFGKIFNMDGHNSPGVNNLSKTWYAIASAREYRTWVLFMNVSSQTANVTVKLTSEDGRQMVRYYAVPANTRKTVQLNFVW